MTVADVGLRRYLLAAMAAMLLFGALSVIAVQRAEAAYPGGSDWIVFESLGDGDRDLYVVPADGSGSVVKATDSLYYQADPAFSPDGTKVAFASDHSGDSKIYVATFNPAATFPLGAQASWTQVSDGLYDGAPTWSPDGTTIAYEGWTHFDRPAAPSPIDSVATNTITDAEATFLTWGVYPGMPITNDSDGSAATVESVTSETVLTTTALTGGTDNTWTATDTYTIDVGHARVYTTAANGSTVGAETQVGEQTVTPTFSQRDPAWSPTGSVIAVTSTERSEASQNSNIYTLTPTDNTGASATNLTNDGATGIDAPATSPSWSPAGDFVVFQTKEPDSADENLWKVNAAGSSATQISTTVTDDNDPAWSPDGTQIAFRNGTTGTIYLVSSAGGTPVALTTAGTPAGEHAGPDWQPTLKGVNDAAAVNEHGSVDIDVLANDLVLTSSVGTVTTSPTLVSSPTRGTATRDTDGSFIYEHTGPEIGTSPVVDTFTYTVTQGSHSSTAQVTVTINPVNDAPVAVADEYAASHAATLNVSAAQGVLINDTDPEGGGLSAVKVSDPAHGSLTLNANGSFTYTNDGASSAAVVDTFTYTANDGTNDSAVTTVTINVGPENPDPPSVTVSGPSFGAPGVEASYSSSVADGSGPRVYDWSVTLGGSEVASGTSTSLAFTPATPGAYTVSLTVTDDAGVDTDSVTLTVMTDIASSVFVNDIVWLANEGITKGCNPPTNDEYCPTSNVTRGQMAAFLVRFLGLTSIDSTISFDDITGSIFEQDILKLATAGITKGCNPGEGNTKYCPNDPVTRGQMAAFLVRALALTDDGGGNLFTDDDTSIFESQIDKLATAGITKGCNPPDNTLYCPDGLVTRGQMAAFLHRADAFK